MIFYLDDFEDLFKHNKKTGKRSITRKNNILYVIYFHVYIMHLLLTELKEQKTIKKMENQLINFASMKCFPKLSSVTFKYIYMNINDVEEQKHIGRCMNNGNYKVKAKA